ncbi:hypothetical protein PIROE2DRAFT_61951 [Piromyces sp. E2]|nr:hypothetical protein PIROE2DRAFT_61951 [Piromyces sp. E2]|eukprot:OUM62367.1 hypothetical protein PIROE2DRAFT_61951 [Piromyces sp. E2]
MYDVENDLLIRVGIIDDTILILDINHKVIDGYSFMILLNELNDIYYGKELEKLPIQFSDFAIYYDEKIQQPIRFKKQIEFYQSLFDKYYKNVELPLKHDNTNNKEAKTVHLSTDSRAYETVNYISKKYNLTKTAICLTVFGLVMSIHSNQNKIPLTIVKSNRGNPILENLIGFFATPVPILLKMESMKLVDLIQKMMHTIFTINNCDVPTYILSEKIKFPKFNLFFHFNPYEMTHRNNDNNLLETIKYEDIFKIMGREDLIPKPKTPLLRMRTDLAMNIYEQVDYYDIKFVYSSIYDDEICEKIVNDYVSILENLDNYEMNLNNILINYQSLMIKNNKNLISKDIINSGKSYETYETDKTVFIQNENQSKSLEKESHNENETDKANEKSNEDLVKSNNIDINRNQINKKSKSKDKRKSYETYETDKTVFIQNENQSKSLEKESHNENETDKANEKSNEDLVKSNNIDINRNQINKKSKSKDKSKKTIKRKIKIIIKNIFKIKK